ncbi:hypothetical protein JXB37_00870 [candidate division WOR-3 bacterium]|nr:hypothetical protein [candidate division WOR-3 bacterium]
MKKSAFPLATVLAALLSTTGSADFELVIDGGFEEPAFYSDHVADAWRVHDTITTAVTAVPGRYGSGFSIEALAADSLCGIRTSFATDLGTGYSFKLWHRGGAGRAAILEAGTGSFGRVLPLGVDTCWTEYGCGWTATSPGAALFLLDNPGGHPAQFDDVSFSEPPSGSMTFEPPINIVFVIHVEHGAGPDYDAWMNENEWLKDICSRQGFRMTYLTHGAYMEEMLVEGDEDSMQVLIGLGHQVGTHNHNVIRVGPQEWRTVEKTIWDSAYASWRDNREWIDSVVGAVNNLAVSPVVHLPFEAALMDTFGYPQTVSGAVSTPETRGREQVGWDFIGHQPFHPFRPGASEVEGEQWLEDVGAGFVNIEHYAQVGHAMAHGFPCQVDDLKRFFRHIYKQWLSKESNPEPNGDDKVWTYGFLTHLGTNPIEIKLKVDSLMTWLNDSFVGKATPRGNLVARTATVQQVHEEFQGWQSQHPGETSFSFLYPELGGGIAETDAWFRLASCRTVMFGSVLLVRERAMLFDASGRAALQLEPGENDLGRLAAGVYYVIGTDHRTARRVVKPR